MNRDNEVNLIILLLFEVNKLYMIVFYMCALDCGLDNSIFAAIELDYGDADVDLSGEVVVEVQKYLMYYEFDLGLNYVVCKWSELIDNGVNYLIFVLGGSDGSGGVLVCCENFVIYRYQNYDEVWVVILC